jgi:exonuclease III
LSWNVRGINSQQKWTAIKRKILDTKSDIICLQETKREVFDQNYLKNFRSAQFDCHAYIPSVRNSGEQSLSGKAQDSQDK